MTTAKIQTEMISLPDIYDLADKVLISAGCNAQNAAAIARTVMRAERDGSVSHGLFRVPGYVGSLQSGKVSGHAEPKVTAEMSCIIEADAQMGYAPLALERGLPELAKAASKHGVAVMKVINSFHFAALWPETEYLAEQGLVGLACTAYKPSVAPAGTTEPFFGTNPISFAWPRPGQSPVVYDMATATLAKGDVQIAARDGHNVPLGTGLGPDGQMTTDPAEILKGVLLPFGGYKGSAIALMVELLCSGLTGDHFSYEAEIYDIADGGPAKGGEFILAMSPRLIAGVGWEAHCEAFFDKLSALEGIRLPGARRHCNRTDGGLRSINASLLEKIRSL